MYAIDTIVMLIGIAVIAIGVVMATQILEAIMAVTTLAITIAIENIVALIAIIMKFMTTIVISMEVLIILCLHQ